MTLYTYQSPSKEHQFGCAVEQPNRDRPERHEFSSHQQYYDACVAYDEYFITMKHIPFTSIPKEKEDKPLKEGDGLVEGVDFKLQHQYKKWSHAAGGYPGDWRDCTEAVYDRMVKVRIVAVPIVKKGYISENIDELTLIKNGVKKEGIRCAYCGYMNGVHSKKCKQKYHDKIETQDQLWKDLLYRDTDLHLNIQDVNWLIGNLSKKYILTRK